jgi:ADP-heptose:LPS heptosyltransferase
MADFSVKKALTLRAASIGDTLMGKYFLENIHATWPDAELTLLVGSRVRMIADLFKGYPWLRIVEVNRKNIPALIRSWQQLRGQDITLTQYAENPFSLPSKIFARMVTRRGGFAGFEDHFWGNKFVYDRLVPFAGEEGSEGMIIEEQKALKALGVPVAVTGLTLAYVEDRDVHARFGVEPKQYVIAHLFSGNEGRSVSPTKRASIVRALRESLPTSHQLLLTGVTGEYGAAVASAQGMNGIQVLAGKTTVQELINLLARASAVVALDSGAAHISAHLGTPLVVLTRTAALKGWWSSAMYNNKPVVLVNHAADDLAPRNTVYPPSLETIENSAIVATVAKLLN